MSAEEVPKTFPWIMTLPITSVILLLVWTAIYNLYFHPLRSYPGPLLWRISRLPRDYYALKGELLDHLLVFHKRYGTAVRMAPNELSFASAQAHKDVLSHVPGRDEFPKDPRRLQRPPNGIISITGAEKHTHSRYRRLLSHAFSEKGLREQEPRIRSYADLLVDRLGERADASEVTNMVDWYAMTNFDVIGDLAWGDNFGCLKTRSKHEWITALVLNLKHVSYMAVLRRWVRPEMAARLIMMNAESQQNLDGLAPWLLDSPSVKGRTRNFELTQDMIDRRAEYDGPPRGDFWDHVLIKSENDNEKGEGLTKGEMLVNASVLVVGGVETGTTALSGATFLLLKHPEKMKKLVQELRSTYKSSDDIGWYQTLDSSSVTLTTPRTCIPSPIYRTCMLVWKRL